MLLKLFLSKWTPIAGVLLMGGALAWAFKLGVIIATNGEVITTGAAALLMKIGLILFMIGSTGIGLWLSQKGHPVLRVVAMLLSPALVFGSFLLCAAIMAPIMKNLNTVWYATQESPIGLAVLLYMTVGYLLYKSRARMTHQPASL